MENDVNSILDNDFRTCKNAGIVLLLPFLNRLFDNLQLTKDGKFINEQKRKTAVQMLVFLANGDESQSEQDYLLPKLLCGIENNELIILDIHLSLKQIEEGEILLKSVIEHWQVLQNVSVESFRETFLQRDGKIKVAEKISLEVETFGIDILQENLPWGYRIYKLPWMNKVIETQWY